MPARTVRKLPARCAKHETLQPPGWPQPKGYANGIKARGEFVFVGGMVGWDENEKFPRASSRRRRQALAEHRRGAGRGRREAGAHRAADLVRARHGRVSRRPPRARRGLSRGDGRPFPGDGAGAGRPAVRAARRGSRSRRRRWCRSSDSRRIARAEHHQQRHQGARRIRVRRRHGRLGRGEFPQGFVAQARQALENIVAVLAEGGARPEHIVRMTWYVLDMDEYLAARRSSAGLSRGDGRTFRRWRWSGPPLVEPRRGSRSRRRRCRLPQPRSQSTAQTVAMIAPAMLAVARAAARRCSAMISGGISRTTSRMPSGSDDQRRRDSPAPG